MCHIQGEAVARASDTVLLQDGNGMYEHQQTVVPNIIQAVVLLTNAIAARVQPAEIVQVASMA